MPPRKVNGKGKERPFGATATALSMPDDVLRMVFQQLPLKDLVRSAGVCKAWHRVAREAHTWQGRELNLCEVNGPRQEGLSNVPDVFLGLVQSVVMWSAEWGYLVSLKGERRCGEDELPQRARDAARSTRERLLAMSDDEALSEGIAMFGGDSWKMRDPIRESLFRDAIENLQSTAYREDAERLCLHGKVPNGRLTELDLSGAVAATAGFFAVIAEHLAPQLKTLVCKIDSVTSPLVDTDEDGGEARRALLDMLRRAGQLSVLRMHSSLEADELVAVAEATAHRQSLREIDCSWSENVTDEAVTRLAAAAPDLQLFTYAMVGYNRSGISPLTSAGAKAIRDQCPSATVDIRLMKPGGGPPRHPLDKYTLRL